MIPRKSNTWQYFSGSVHRWSSWPGCPDKGHVTTRDYDWYANRPRGMCQKAAPTGADQPPAIVPARPLAPTEASRRWATLLQQIFEVDPLACPSCHGATRIVAFITQTSVIDQILTHLRIRASREAHAGSRSPATMRGPVAWAAVPTEPRIGPRWHRPPSREPPVARPTRRTMESAGTPLTVGGRSRGRRSRRILFRPRSKFLSRKAKRLICKVMNKQYDRSCPHG